MDQSKQRELKRIARHQRIRKGLYGTTQQPRLCVHRSLKNLSAQIIDDTNQKVLMGVSTLQKEFRNEVKSGGNIKAAEHLGEQLAVLAKGKGVTKVCFDRGGYLYHGRVKAFAEGARKGGLEF